MDPEVSRYLAWSSWRALAAAGSGPDGLHALLELAAQLGANRRPETRRQVLEWGLKTFEKTTADVNPLKDALNAVQ